MNAYMIALLASIVLVNVTFCGLIWYLKSERKRHDGSQNGHL